MQYVLFCIPNVLSKFYNNHYWFLILSIIMQTICHLTIWHNTNVVIYLHNYLNNAIKQDIRINLPNMTLCIHIFKHITRMYAFSVSHICHVWMIISVSYLNNWSRSSEVSNNVILCYFTEANTYSFWGEMFSNCMYCVYKNKSLQHIHWYT